MRSQHKLIYEFNGKRDLYKSPLDIPRLQGDTYDYIFESTASSIVVSPGRLFMNFNKDYGNNYRVYEISGDNRYSNQTYSSSTFNRFQLGADLGVGSVNRGSTGRCFITGKSGEERCAKTFKCSTLDTILNRVGINVNYWKNTSNELTSAQISSDTSSGANSYYNIRLYQVPKESNLENYDLIEEKTFSNSSTDLTFSGLNGDLDVEYLLEWKADKIANFHYNTDTNTTNYTYQTLDNTTASGQSYSKAKTGTRLPLLQFDDRITIYASTGKKRLSTNYAGGNMTLSSTYSPYQLNKTTWYSNKDTNITSIVVGGLVSAKGTCKLYKRRSNKTIDPVPMKTIAEIPVCGDFSKGVTLSGLSGDDLDAIKVEWIGNGTGSNACEMRMQVGGSSLDVASNYALIYLQGAGTSVSVGYFGDNYWVLGDVSNECSNTTWLHPKTTGASRPGLSMKNYNTSLTQIRFDGFWWKNLRTELEQIKVYTNNTNSISGFLKISIPKTNETHCKVTFNKQ